MIQPLGNKFIGEIQLHDKYARWVPHKERRETWPEVCERVIGFLRASPAAAKLPDAIWDNLRDAMERKDVLPSMRIVQMAGPSLDRCHVGAYNCLAGDEQFVTQQGLKTFGETVGTTQTVLCADGLWRAATVQMFGEARVQVVTLRPGDTKTSLRRMVRATANHGWVTTRGHVRDLRVGDQVVANAAKDQGLPVDWVRGFLFGDGTVQDGDYTRVRLCGSKIQYLEKFNVLGARVSYPESSGGEPTVSWPRGTLVECKTLPAQPTAQWLQGYFAADGDQGCQPTISTVRADVLPYLQEHSAELGIMVTGHSVWTKDSNFGPRKPLHKIGIRPADFTSWRVVAIEETDEVVPVYCVTEPETHTFTLAGGLTSMNCAYTVLEGPRDLAELLYILMQGTGVGYSVERKYVDAWPEVVDTKARPLPPHVIEDTTEGWAEAFRLRIEGALKCQPQEFDYSQIRPEGAWLHTKGGRASGPEPLKQLIEAAWNIIVARRGGRLRPLDVHRLATMCGSIVQVGGVRRAAELALFDADDMEMLQCKNGEFWHATPELAMANNSVVATGPVSDSALLSWMAQLSSNGTGEPGVFRRDGVVPARRLVDPGFGTNPCGEIILRPRQFCNLSVAVARPHDTAQTLEYKVNLATIFGTLQSTLTTFSYLGPQWKVNCDEERLLGVDITGACDCPLLTNPDATPRLLGHLRDVAVEVNKGWAQHLGIPQSAAVTCNKPSGNSAQFLDTSSGIHARYAPYYVRRLRIAGGSPIGLHLQAKGLPVYPEVAQGSLEEAKVWVVELPVKSPEGALVRDQLSAVDQLAYWLMWKQQWTEHNPSCTVYVHDDEWVAVASFLRLYWPHVGGLSFLPKDNSVYALAPYEEITQEDYEERLKALPVSLDLESIVERVDATTINQEYACTAGGVCEF